MSTPGRAQFDPEGKRLLLAQGYGFIIVDADTGDERVQGRFDDWFWTGELRFSGDVKRVAIATWNRGDFGPVRVFDAASGRLEREFGTDMYDCQIGPGGRWAWCSTVGPPTSVQQVWDLTTGSKVQTIEQSGGASMSPDGSTVLVSKQVGIDVYVTAEWRLRQGSK